MWIGGLMTYCHGDEGSNFILGILWNLWLKLIMWYLWLKLATLMWQEKKNMYDYMIRADVDLATCW
jgi:hypothetical protein